MAKFIYQLSFNATQSNPNSNQVHVFITQNRDIESWYIPLPGVYLIKGDKTVFEMQNQFLMLFGETAFLITYLTPPLVGGILPSPIWTWLNDLSPPLLPGS